ncbi:hypothetical protein FBU59_000295 [Linderina macrospora]|uniref:Uncharacterized protein n=1 Tax=Linderina macrospora TaxID=4868 RepID=A0ACC1JHC4_9FUNG|nr:hypothetical protein FBU59_000295 [Linderina macrospora]
MPYRAGSWVGVHDMTDDMRILYISSNLYDIVNVHASDCIGVPATEFITGESLDSYPATFAGHTSDNIFIGYVRVTIPVDTVIVIRTISFVCSNITFIIGSADPTGLYERMMARDHIKRFRYVAKDENRMETLAQIKQAISDVSEPENQTAEDSQQGLHSRTHEHAHVLIQACIVLDNLEQIDDRTPHGPGISFLTNSMEQIIDVDATDLQGIPFLSLVAADDIAKAGKFLQDVASNTDISFTTLKLFRNPFGAPVEEQSPAYVTVELMGAGSESGAILLCQPAVGLQLRRMDCDQGDDAGYMTLEELVSSEAETSGYDSAWRDIRAD